MNTAQVRTRSPRRCRIGLLLTVLLVTATTPLAGQEGILSSPEEVARGTAFRVLSSVAGQVRLATREGTRIAETRAFPLRVTRDREVAVALLGAPSTIAPGEYELLLLDDAGNELDRRGIRLGDREFQRQRIALNRSLTELRATPDPEKVAEARELITLVAQVNPGAIYGDGSFELPVEDFRRTSRYGDRRTYSYSDGERANAIHFGVDLAAPTGTPVRASAPGVVAFAGDRIVTGGSVVVEHLPGVYGLYYHLDSRSVEVGDRVARGGVLGTVGATGLATGPHLHWEIRVAGVPVDPERLLAGVLLDRATIYQDILETVQEGR